jgi:hypothetical protein
MSRRDVPNPGQDDDQPRRCYEPGVSLHYNPRERSRTGYPLVSHCPISSPTLLSHETKLTTSAPTMHGTNQPAPTYARAFFRYAARLTPSPMETISIAPSAHPSRVVWRGVNPKEETMI